MPSPTEKPTVMLSLSPSPVSGRLVSTIIPSSTITVAFKVTFPATPAALVSVHAVHAGRQFH